MGIIKSLLYKNFHTSGQEQYVYIGMISRAWRGKKKLALLNIFNGPKNGFLEWKKMKVAIIGRKARSKISMK